jgi:hypothetical protein
MAPSFGLEQANDLGIVEISSVFAVFFRRHHFGTPLAYRKASPDGAFLVQRVE